MSTTDSLEGPAPPVWRLRIRRFWTLGQVLVYSAANVGQSLLGAVGKALIARAVSVAGFGAFNFALAFLQLAALLFEFGLFIPAARLIAHAKGNPDEQRSFIGAAIAAFAVLGLLFDLVVFGTSFVVNDIFHVHAGGMLRAVSPLAWIFPFAFVAIQLSQGLNRLHVYSVSSTTGQLLFVGALAALSIAGTSFGATAALVIRAFALGIGWLILIVWLRPRWHGLRARARTLITHARDYGFNVYVGRVFSIGTYNMDVLMLGGLANARAVGLYTLAGAIAAALGLPASGLAAALFPKMTGEPRIRRRWLLVSLGTGSAAIVIAWLLSGPFLGVVFPHSYGSATDYVVPLALAQMVRGLTELYNSFLSAHGRGRDLRTAGLVLTGSNLVLNLALIPPFGATGAAWASVAALLANLAAHVFGYRRTRHATTAVS